VVNETGIPGNYDVELDLPEGDSAAAKQTLLQTLGLELRQEDRPILMIEITLPAKP
jgi:hypothetical protein